MATWSDVRRLALALPEAAEPQPGQWRVRSKLFAWERPLRKADIAALGPNAYDGPILGVRTPDLGAKQALLDDDPTVYFTTPHFDGYPAVLVRLPEIDPVELGEVLAEAWLTQAPKRLAKEFLATLPTNDAH
jgi:hypothetical protein